MINSEQKPQQFTSLRVLGSTGINQFDDPQDVKDTDVTDALNIVFDKGYPTPRKGSVLAWDVPSGETNVLLNLFAARASDGTNYALAIYAPNFYLRDETNNQWVQLNNDYTPSGAYKTLMYGYTNWNAGIGNDVLYCGNGVEPSIKWQIAVGYVKTAANLGETSLILDDSTKFPATGTIVIQEAGQSAIFTTYSVNYLNTLTIPSLSANVGIGACVAFQIADATNVAKGKIFTNFQRRLLVANQFKFETTLFASEMDNAENFTIGGNYGDSFAIPMTDGLGGIVGVDTFGEYLVVSKQDSLYKVTIDNTSTADVSSQEIEVLPLAMDVSMGPVQPGARIKKNNLLIYATQTEGVQAVNPDVTGANLTTRSSIISRNITPLIKTLDFSNSHIVAFEQKVLISCASNTTSDTVIVYDIQRSTQRALYVNNPATENHVWSRFNGWAVQDWLLHNKKLYYANRTDNKIYQCFTDAKIDDSSPYVASFSTKRWDFGQGAMPKTMNKLFVSGYISNNEKLLFDLTLVTGDTIQTIYYELDGNGNLCVQNLPVALAMQMLGVPTLGMFEVTSTDSDIGIFRGYLAVPSRYGFYTIQLTPHSQVNGTDWGFTGIGFSPWLETRVPENLTIGGIGDANTGL